MKKAYIEPWIMAYQMEHVSYLLNGSNGNGSITDSKPDKPTTNTDSQFNPPVDGGSL